MIESSDDRFRFDASTGVYVWDADAEQWVEEGGSDSVILEFPATEGATSNNATLELSQYTDTPLTVDGETVYLPTSGIGAISVDGSEVFSVDLSGVDYATEEGLEVPIPQSFSLEVLTAPHTHTFNLNENSSTDYDFSFDLRNGDQLVVGISVGAQLATNNYDELEPTDMEELSGELRIGPELTILYTIGVGELAAFDDPTEEQINNRIDATVESEGQELATLRYDEASERIEVVYSDGSIDPASDFFTEFLNDMEALWTGYLGGDTFETVLDGIRFQQPQPRLPPRNMNVHLVDQGSRSRRVVDKAGLCLLGACLLVAGLASTSTAQGQDVRADSVWHQPYQVGVSASSLFKLLEEGSPTRQYQAYGRHWTSPQRMSRVALRYRQVVGGNTEVDVGVRGGVARVFRLTERWRFYGGGDVIAGYRRFANGRESYRGGVSPLFGALFFLGPHVSLSLEPRLVATYVQSRGDDQSRSTSERFSIAIEETALLILSVHF